MRKLRYCIDLILLAMVFLGVTVHLRPAPPPVSYISSALQKKAPKESKVSRTIIDKFASKFTSNQQFPKRVSDFLVKTSKGKSRIEYVKLMSEIRNPDSPFWEHFPPNDEDATEHFYRATSDGEPDSFVAADDDFTTQVRVNNVTTNTQFQPDFTVGSDGTIYASWGSDDSGDGVVCFSKSTDGGQTWSPRMVVDNIGPNRYTEIAAYGSGSTAHIYITYTYLYDPSYYDYDIYLAYSSNGGSSWSIIAISASEYYESLSDVAVDASGYVYIVYTYADWSSGSCDDGDVDHYIVYKYSATGGSSWSSAIILISSGGCTSGLPAFDFEGGGANAIMHFAYVYDYNCSSSNTDYDARYRKYGNVGSGSPTLLLTDRWIAASTSDEYVIPDGIAVDNNGDPHIAYCVDSGSDSGSVYYRRSNDGGSTFQPPVTISNGSWYEIDPVIDTDPTDNPVIAWRDHRHGDGDIYFTWSPDGGNTFVPKLEVDQEVTAENQYWPSIISYNESSCKRHLHFGWWNSSTDGGDIYYNGNRQQSAILHIAFPTGTPPNLPHFVYHDFDQAIDSTISAAGDYMFWYDPEYTGSYEPLLDEILDGSTALERWACDNPGGWIFLAPSYWWGNGVCGEFDVGYYHQVYVEFAPVKGNPGACTHVLPNVNIQYDHFGYEIDTFANSSVSVTDWVDYASSYFFRGWIDISPHERWAITSADTMGTANFPGTISPVYYHQWLPHIWFAGTDTGNHTWTTLRTYLGYSLLDDSLITDWMDWVDCGNMLAFSETTSLGHHAINDYDTLVTGWIPSYTVIYTIDNFVTVQTDFGSGTVKLDGVLYYSPHSELLGPGTDHSIEAPTPQTFDDTVQYNFSQWFDGPTDTVRTITVPDHDITYTAEYNRWFKINLGYTGSTGGHIPVLTGDGWYQEGTWATITATDGFDSTTGIRYGFSHWESNPPGATFLDTISSNTDVLVDNYYQITAVYSVQYSLEISSDYGFPNPPVGTNWFDAGGTVTAIPGSPDTIEHKYCSGFLASGSGLPSSSTADSITFVIIQPTLVTWLWTDQLWLYVVSLYGSPNPPAGINYYDPGTDISASVDSIMMLTADMRQLCRGYTGTDGIGSGGDNNVDFTITTTCTLTWNFQTQYTFEVINPGGHDTPFPAEGEQWYDEGDTITAYVSSPTATHICIGYYGTGSLSPVAPYDSVLFYIHAPTTIQWRWALLSDVVSLTVNSPSDAGDPFPNGTTWWLIGATVEAFVTSPWFDSYPDGIRDSCTGWSGTGSASGSGTNDSTAFVINVNSTLDWSWQRQYRFTVNNPLGYDTPNPAVGEYWFDDGTIITGSVTSPWEDSILCSGYDGEGSLPDGSGTSFSFAIDTPSVVTWNWEVNNVILNVISTHGSPDPTVGLHTYIAGTVVHCSVDSVIYGPVGERWVCIGWNGTGSVPASGDSNAVDITIIEDSQIEWLWKHQSRLTVNDGGHGTASPPDGDNWFDDGDTIVCTIAPNPVDTFFCVGYSGTGDVPLLEYGTDSTTIVLTTPSTITWIWLGASSVCALSVSTDYGEPYPNIGVHYYPCGTVVNGYIPDATDSLTPGVRRHCVGYSGTGSVGSGSDTSITFTINTNSTIEWLWQVQDRFTVINPGGYDSPNPPEGEHWFEEGSVITASVTAIDDTMRCVGYYGTGSVPGTGWGASVTFTLNLPSSVEWRWLGESGVCILDVSSAHDNPYPPVGTNYIPCGEWVVANVDLVDSTSPGSGWFCTNWSGSGSVPPTGDTNFTVFQLNEYSILNWIWQARHLIVLTYAGETGGEIPTQTGGGWYIEDDTVTIYTDPVLFDGSIHYGFTGWEMRGGSIWLEYPEFYQTDIEVSVPCTLVAHYSVAVACTLAKSPTENWGGFVVDGILYPWTSQIEFWWGRGSNHLIEATTPDFSGDSTEAYGFDHWSDDGDTTHWVEASASFVLYAYYNHQFQITIRKEPPRSFGYIRADEGFIFDYQYTTWWDEGSVNPVVVSNPDLGMTERYYLNHWSDGDTSYIRDFGPIDSPLDLIAYYDSEVKISVDKDPLESFGSITLNDSTYDSVSSVAEWLPMTDSITVDVSRVDVDEITDTAYIFSHWDDEPADSIHPKELGILSTGTNLTAHYDKLQYRLEFTANPAVWDLDTLDRIYTRTMYPYEVIRLTNTGTIPIDFGLQTIEDFTSWTAGYGSAYNRYVLRAEFDQNIMPPESFVPSLDYVKNTLFWSTSIIFGPMGYNVSASEWLNIWLQFITPTSTFDYTRQTIILQVWARPTLY